MSRVCGETRYPRERCRTSAVVLTKKKRPNICVHFSIALFAPYQVPRLDFSRFEKSACSPSAVNNSYKTYYRTPVPLLVRFLSYVPSGVARNLWNVFKTKLKQHRFSEVNFQKVLLAPVPLIVVCVDIASFVAMCQKHKKSQYILHAFYVMHGPCGRRNPEFLNRPLDTSVVRFFFGVQRSD